MTAFIHQHLGHLSPFQGVLWYAYLVAAIMLPVYHVRPIVKYLRGNNGIGDACIRTEVIQSAWRVPALLFSIFVVPSLPLFLSISLDLVGRVGRILSMQISQRRWHTTVVSQAAFPSPVRPGADSSTSFINRSLS